MFLSVFDVFKVGIGPSSSHTMGAMSAAGRFLDELLNGEIFYTLREAKVLIERWRRHYNTIRPHSALGYRPPAPQTLTPSQGDLRSAQQGLRADRRQPKELRL